MCYPSSIKLNNLAPVYHFYVSMSFLGKEDVGMWQPEYMIGQIEEEIYSLLSRGNINIFSFFGISAIYCNLAMLYKKPPSQR